MDTSAQRKSPDSYQPGDMVWHKVFGQGQVLKYSPAEDGDRVQVNFETAGIKCLAIKYVALQRGIRDTTPDPDEEELLSMIAEITVEAPPPEYANPLQSAPKTTKRRDFLKHFAGFLGGCAAVATVKPVTAKPAKKLPVLETRIAGFAHYQGAAHLTRIKPGDRLKVRREPSNRHDNKAIEVFWQSHKIGYVPRSHNAVLSKLLDRGEMAEARVTQVLQRPWEPLEFEVEVWV